MKTKVMYIITKSNWGGAQKYVYDLATGLPKDAYEVSVALGGTGAKGAPTGMLAEKLGRASVSIHFIESFSRDIGILREWRTLVALITLLRSERPDVVHLNSSKAAGLGGLAAYIARVPIRVVTIHGFAFREQLGPTSRIMRMFLSWLTLLCATCVICVAKSDAAIARSWPFVGRRIISVPLGIHTPTLLSREEARAALSARVGRDISDTILIGTIGELTRNKGQRYLLDAVSMLKNTAVELVVVGTGDLAEILHTHARTLGIEEKVHFVSIPSDAASFLRAFDVFVLPSLKEGFPYVLLEASHAGLPIVATSVGGVRDIVEDGATGKVVPPGDANALAQAIASLLQDRAEATRLGNSAREFVNKTYSIECLHNETYARYSR